MKYARSQAKGVALQRPDPGISGQLSSVFKQSRLLCGTPNRKTSNILRGNGHRDWLPRHGHPSHTIHTQSHTRWPFNGQI